jgi:hypothetical protein
MIDVVEERCRHQSEYLQVGEKVFDVAHFQQEKHSMRHVHSMLEAVERILSMLLLDDFQ